MSEIVFLDRNSIDTTLWDNCISQSMNASIYGYSWYLDAVAEHQWAGLVMGNYEAVFPLPWRKKFCIKYVYQPFFCQQLGLFSSTIFDIDQSVFINAIPKEFKRIHLQLNLNYPIKQIGTTKPNYILNLNKNYSELRAGFKDDALKNLKKSEKKDVVYMENVMPNIVMELYGPTWGSLNSGMNQNDYHRFLNACEVAKSNHSYWGIGAYLDGKLLGAGIFLKSPKRLHYLVSGPTVEGRKISIMHGIINYAIKQFAGTDLILDFEGSRIPEVAKFYQKWGSHSEKYLEILVKRNILG